MYGVKGDFHFHSLHSACHNRHQVGAPIDYHLDCGPQAVSEMIALGVILKKQGYEYLAITNHVTDPLSTKKATKAETASLLDHLRQINQLNWNKQCTIRILAGIEVNILDNKGNLSLPNNILKKLDVVIASNHRETRNLTKESILAGFVNAIKNQEVDIIGHLTRYINYLTLTDWTEIIALCEERNKIIEFNIRASLKKEVLTEAARSTLFWSVGSDTHPEIIAAENFTQKKYVRAISKEILCAIKFLVKNGVAPKRIINTFPLKKIKMLFNLSY